MKKLSVLFCLALLAMSCEPKKEKKTGSGPLSAIQTYHVMPVCYSYDSADRETILDNVTEMLKKMGAVHISTGCVGNVPSSEAFLALSLGESEEGKKGEIKIFAESEVVANGFKSSSDVWATHFRDPTLAYPVDTEEGIVFKKDAEAKSPEISAVATQMLTEFIEKYQQDNPGSIPTFYIHRNFLPN